MSIEIDDSFASYTELQERLEEFKQATYTDLYIWDSQIIQNKTQQRNESKYQWDQSSDTIILNTHASTVARHSKEEEPELEIPGTLIDL